VLGSPGGGVRRGIVAREERRGGRGRGRWGSRGDLGLWRGCGCLTVLRGTPGIVRGANCKILSLCKGGRGEGGTCVPIKRGLFDNAHKLK